MASTLAGFAFLDSLLQWKTGAFSPQSVAETLLAHFDNPQDTPRSIHVAGTNGKGTTCAFIANILLKAGFSVGQFSSPHLSDVRERCRINGDLVSHENFNQALVDVRDAVQGDPCAISYFVATTVASFLVFRRLKLDWIVVETGLGGTLDATNLLAHPECCVITSISKDHCDVLGSSLSEIARNKAGIVKRQAKVFAMEVFPEIVEAVEQKQAQWGELQGKGEIIVKPDCLQIVFQEHRLNIEPLSLFLSTPYVQKNMLLAAQVCLSLGISPQLIEQGIASTRWPGRVELLGRVHGHRVLVDAAHNPAGVEALIEALMSFHSQQNLARIVFLLGMRERDGWQESIATLKEGRRLLESKNVRTEVVGVRWNDELALDPSSQLELNPLPFEKLDDVLQSAVEDTFYVGLGSIFFIAQLRDRWGSIAVEE